MSNPSKAWAMMTARGVRIGGSFGGIPELTPSDIARMLKDLGRGPFLAGMVREGGDASCLGELERCLWMAATRMADPVDLRGRPITELAWPLSHGQAYCRRLAGLAVFEFAIPKPQKCDDCEGRGWKRRDGQGVACPSCSAGPADPRIATLNGVSEPEDDPGSTGYRSLQPAMRAELAGIPLRSWKDGWSGRYELVYREVCSWHSIAMSHLRRALEARFEAA